MHLSSVGRRLIFTLLAMALVLVGIQLAVLATWSGPKVFTLLVAALLLGFAALSYLNILMTRNPRGQRLAGRVVTFSFLPPIVLAVPQGLGAFEPYAEAFVIGTLAWIAISLGFSLAVVGRLERQAAAS